MLVIDMKFINDERSYIGRFQFGCFFNRKNDALLF